MIDLWRGSLLEKRTVATAPRVLGQPRRLPPSQVRKQELKPSQGDWPSRLGMLGQVMLGCNVLALHSGVDTQIKLLNVGD